MFSSVKSHFLLARLESAYSLIWGSHKILGQDLGTFMISRPTYQDSDWWKFSIWKSRICLSVTSFYTSQQCGVTSTTSFLFLYWKECVLLLGHPYRYICFLQTNVCYRSGAFTKVCSDVTDLSPSFAPFNRPCFLLPIKRTIKRAKGLFTYSRF